MRPLPERLSSLGAVLLCLAHATSGCERSSSQPSDSLEDAAPSPNASILPGPLAPSQALGVPPGPAPIDAGLQPHVSFSDAGFRLGLATDASIAIAPAEIMRSDQPPDPDPVVAKDLAGLVLDAEWRQLDVPSGPKAPEVNVVAIDAARRLTTPKWIIDLAEQGRMRVQLTSRGFALEPGMELRARVDRYGHVLVWPDASEYRVLPPGTVRTLLNERRVDASPLVRAQGVAAVEGQRRLGLVTRKQELSTRTGKVVLEQAHVIDAGAGGLVLCRLLTELVAIDPEFAPCAPEELPVRAQYTWPNGGGIVFEITSMSRRPDLLASALLVPPVSASYVSAGLSPSQGRALLGRDELAAFRTKPVDTGPPLGKSPVPDGLIAYNGTDTLRFVFVDGVPVAWGAPGHEEYIGGLPRGRYLVQWRTFLGDASEPAELVDLPRRTTAGGARDAGAAVSAVP